MSIADGVVGGAPAGARRAGRPARGGRRLWPAGWPTSPVSTSTGPHRLCGVEAGACAHQHAERSTRGARCICVGHDVDRLFPDIAAEAGSAALPAAHAPSGIDRTMSRFEPAVLTGSSLLRYGGIRRLPVGCRSTAAASSATTLQLIDADVNLMFTQRPDGDLLIGDTHHYDRTVDPFRREELDDLILSARSGACSAPTDST